jgi:hypothetical protein
LTQARNETLKRIASFFQTRSVRWLLVSMVGAALLPVFLISFAQAYARLSDDHEVARRTLVDSAMRIAAHAKQVIDTAELALTSVGLRPDVMDAAATCSQTLATVQLGMPYVTNLARIDARGTITCVAAPIRSDPDFSGRPWWQSLHLRDP